MGNDKDALKAKYLPAYLEATYEPIPTTIAQFLDNYSKNLSYLQCPSCLKDCGGFLAPPDTFKEHVRTAAVEQYLRLEHWKNRKIFQYVTTEVRKTIGVFGVSVSLIHKNTTYVKYETKLEFKELPRVVLLDAHAILSKGGLVLCNATNDWRTSQNPLVTGPPNIRFYAGVNLVTSSGIAIGVLAIFSTLPKVMFSQTKVKQLSKVAAQLMAVLDTPLELVGVCDEKYLPVNPNAGDFELAELSSRLGRATCSGGHMTIFERDGSGSCYSHSHIFKLSHYQEHHIITESLVQEPRKTEIHNAVKGVTSLKSVCKHITKTIAADEACDCVVVVEIRFMELHRVARSMLPDNPDLGIPQRVQKLLIATSRIRSEKCKVRVLACNRTDHDMASTDHRVWQEAFMNETGCEIVGSTGASIYKTGVIMPFFVSKPNVIKKDKTLLMADPVELYLRSGGYMVGAFKKSSNRSGFNASVSSRVFDHIKIARTVYLSK